MKMILLKPFYNVVINSTAQLVTQELDGYSIHGLHALQGGGNSLANTNNIWIKYAFQDIIHMVANVGSALVAGQMLDAINQWKLGNGNTTAGYLTFHFGNPELPDANERHVGDLDTSVHKGENGVAGTLEVYHDLLAGAAPTLSMYAEVEAPKIKRGLHPLNCLEHKVYLRSTPPVAGALNAVNLDVDEGAKIGAQLVNENWFHGHLTSLEIKRENVELWQNLPVALVSALQQYYNHKATAGLYVYSPTYQKGLRKMIASLKADGVSAANFIHQATTGAADTIDIYSEVIANRYDGGTSITRGNQTVARSNIAR